MSLVTGAVYHTTVYLSILMSHFQAPLPTENPRRSRGQL
jgi:hypothetical protein